MKKLVAILLFSLLIKVSFNNKSFYSNETTIEGYIIYYKIDDKKITFKIKAKEKIIAKYYFKDESELKKLNMKIELGSYIKLKGKLEKPNNNTNFNLFNYRKYLISQKINWIFLIDEFEIKPNTKIMYKIKNWIIKRLDKSSLRKYLRLFIIGENYLDSEIKESYQKNGINHLFAISGMHITLFSFFLSFVLKKIIKNDKIIFLLISIFLLFYAFLTSFSLSVMRSFFLFIGVNLKKYFSINISNTNILIIIFLLFLIFNPYYIYSNAFLYSFIICFCLMHIDDSENYFKNLFKTSIFAFIASIPLNINNYFSINLLSPILNLIFVPFVSFVVFPFSIIIFLIPKLECIYRIIILFLENFSYFFSKFSFLNITFCNISIYLLIFYYILIFISLKKRKVSIIIFFMLILHHNINYFNFNFTITMLDVKQGDSILIQSPNNKTIVLIDTGGGVNNNYNMSVNIIIPYLKSVGIDKISYLILSHGDYDHMGEAINLVNNFKVEKVIFNCGEFNELELDLIKVLDKKKIPYYSCIKELNIDNNKLYFLQTKEYDNENDNSNVIYTELNGYKFMFMGDAGIEKEKAILEKYNISNIDVLKVGHHGSRTSSDKEFVNKINPKYSIISVGNNNRYGHPNKEALDNLKNSKIYRTDQDGSIMFKIKNKKLKIETCSP